jgi:hypothetical protein
VPSKKHELCYSTYCSQLCSLEPADIPGRVQRAIFTPSDRQRVHTVARCEARWAAWDVKLVTAAT